MGELLSICCGRKTNDAQPTRTYGGGGASDLYNIRDPAYVTDNHPGGCDGNGTPKQHTECKYHRLPWTKYYSSAVH